MMTNSVIRSFAWINILGSNGLINRILVTAGIVEKTPKAAVYGLRHYYWFGLFISSSYDRHCGWCHGEYWR